MAEKNKDVAARAQENEDPTVKSSSQAEASPGVEPAPPVEQADDAAVNKVYEDMPDEDKPSPSTVAQVEVRPEERNG